MPYDIDAIVDSADINASIDIYNIVSELSFEWSSIEVLESFIMEGDYLHLHKTDGNLSINFEYTTSGLSCNIINNESNELTESASGDEAYDLCNAYYE